MHYLTLYFKFIYILYKAKDNFYEYNILSEIGL